jgi:hypothetical protein
LDRFIIDPARADCPGIITDRSQEFIKKRKAINATGLLMRKVDLFLEE